MSNPHLQQPVIYHGAPLTAESPVILALHGRKQNTDFILGVTDRLNWPEAAVVAPAATNNEWYPKGFMAPIADNEPFLSHSLARIAQLLDDLKARGVRQRQIILLGFSQGACLVAEYAIRNPGRYGGMVIFTGGVIGPPGTPWHAAGSFDHTPTLITTGDTDAWVPVGRVQETSALFAARGAAVTQKVFSGRDHIVSDAEIEMARTMFVEKT